MDTIDKYLIELLHINEESSNKLIDLNSGRGGACFLLLKEGVESLSYDVYETIKEKIGKVGTTTLRKSSLSDNENIFGNQINIYDWININGNNDPRELNKFVDSAIKETTAKGNNPVFLSLGSIKWTLTLGEDTQQTFRSPILIFPIKLLRTGDFQPISIEFVDDEVYFNPCFYHKFRQTFGDYNAEKMPLPSEDIDSPVDLKSFDVLKYLYSLSSYIEGCKSEDSQDMILVEKDVVAISTYRHDDVTMYYDIKRNKKEILNNKLIRRMYLGEKTEEMQKSLSSPPLFVLPYDSVQERIVARVLKGESLLIKGPPGTGKTQTIANMISTLLAEGKRILFVSKKLSALGEVCRKLPREIQKFVLRLDYENEADAAKINVSGIHKSLVEVLENTVSENSMNYDSERKSVLDKKNTALMEMRKYYINMFGKEVLSDISIYGVIDNLLKNSEIEPLEFASPNDVLLCSYSDYLSMLERVKRAGEIFTKITEGFSITPSAIPWLGIAEKPKEEAISEGKNISNSLFSLIKQFSKDTDEYSLIKRLSLKAIYSLTEYNDKYSSIFSIDNLSPLRGILTEGLDGLKKGIKDIEYAESLAPGFIDLFDEEKFEISDDIDLNLPIGFIKALKEDINIYNQANGIFSGDISLHKVIETLDRFVELKDLIEETRSKAAIVFRKEELEDRKNENIFFEAKEAFLKYEEISQIDKPKNFDLRGKSSLKKLLKFLNKDILGYFEVIIKGTDSAFNYINYQKEANKCLSDISRTLITQISPSQATTLHRFLSMFKKDKKKEAKVYYDCMISLLPEIERAAEHLGLEDYSTLSLYELDKIYRGRDIYRIMKKISDKVRSITGIDIKPRDKETFAECKAFVNAVIEIKNLMDNSLTDPEGSKQNSIEDNFYGRVKSVSEKLTEVNKTIKFKEVLDSLFEFAKRFLPSEYYRKEGEAKFCDLKTFCSLVSDKTLADACIEFENLTKKVPPIDIGAFFRPFVSGEREDCKYHPIGDIFERSYYSILISAIVSSLGDNDSLFGRRINSLFNSYKEAEARLLELNVKSVAELSEARINKKSELYDFLRTNRSMYKVCRLFFKEKAEAILSLKRCFVMSPSTVSLLLRREEYNNFDVLIADEASQISPEYLIPSLFRSKQCVIVGDEWQMPPIKHFVRKNSVNTLEEGMEPITSAMELCVVNNAFPIEELICHYRSKTESLIAYSLHKYYPKMKTFPAVFPISDEVGIKDVRVNGTSSAGENDVEAKKVLEILRSHFEENYEEGKGLKKSVGIVVFGEKQQALIEKYISADKELCKKRNISLSIPKEDGKEIFFLETIEKVQGREINTMILSITYGRNESGEVRQTFGQLNRGNLGERIFNVAVTRAQDSIFLVHSIGYEDIPTNSSVAYIRDYLEMAERLSESNFVSTKIEKGLVLDIAKYLESLGLSRERIIINYGVTDNSIRIPIAILSEDLSFAQLGLMVENYVGIEDYVDSSVRYPDTLESRGWNLYRIFAYDWATNNHAEKVKLKKALEGFVLSRK